MADQLVSALLKAYGQGYTPPQLGDSEDYTTQNILRALKPKQGPIANALGIDPSVERDTILPFQSGSWRFAVPQFAVDAINAADRVGTSPLTDRYARTDENRESMTDTAGAVVGPQIAAGFIRNALAKGGGSELGIFGGRLAQNAPLSKLEMAKWMTESGAPREQVWKETGWFKGADEKWRFEIDDSSFDMVPHLPRRPFPVEDAQSMFSRTKENNYQDHPIFQAYPKSGAKFLGDPVLAVNESYAATRAGRDGNTEIAISPKLGPSDKRSAFLHEYQHALPQTIEGFAKGAGMYEPNYHKFAGEVEARTVQKRMDMTAQERAARPPWLDYDVPEKDQIVSFGGNGPQMSLPPGKSLTNALSDPGFGLVAIGEYPSYAGLISRIKGEGLRSSRSYEASVPLSSIRPLQNPAELEAGRVTRYAENPPPRHVNVNEETGIELFRDGSQYYIGDGHHRFEAARRRGDVALDARVRDIFDPRVGQPPGRALTNALSEEVPHTVVSFDEKMNSILRKYGLLPPAVGAGLVGALQGPQPEAQQ